MTDSIARFVRRIVDVSGDESIRVRLRRAEAELSAMRVDRETIEREVAQTIAESERLRDSLRRVRAMVVDSYDAGEVIAAVNVALHCSDSPDMLKVGAPLGGPDRRRG